MSFRVAIAVAFVTVALFASDGKSKDPKDVTAFMRLKLDHSQKILEGIVTEDFHLIEKSAQDLSLLSRDEMWQVFQTPEYLQHSIEFRRAADDVAGAARKRNVDGAALAYMGMTMRCVECHKHVRDVRMAIVPGKELPPSGE